MEPAAAKLRRWLTPTVRADYARDGFVVLRQFLSQPELARLRSETERAMRGFKWPKGAP